MSVFARTQLAFKLGPRYWSRGWYRAKSAVYKSVRGAPIDLMVDHLRVQHGIIVKNQGAWGQYSEPEVLRMQSIIMQHRTFYSPGRELLLSAERGVQAEAISRAFDYLAANLESMSYMGLPKHLRVSCGTDMATPHRTLISQPYLLQEFPRIARFEDLSALGVVSERSGILQAAMDRNRTELIDKTVLGIERGNEDVRVKYGYEAKIRAETHTKADYPSAFDFDKYTERKYSEVMTSVVQDVVADGIPIEIHHGYPADLEDELSRQGYRVFNLKIKGGNFFELYVAVRDGEYRYAISIADAGRVRHCQQMLRLSGVPGEQVIRYSHITDGYAQVKEIYERLVGVEPHQVIIGNRGTFRRLVKKRRLAVDHLRDMARGFHDLMERMRTRDHSLAIDLGALYVRHRKLLVLDEGLFYLGHREELFVQYAQLEREIEEFKAAHRDVPELERIPTIIGALRRFQKRFGLHREEDFEKLIAVFERASAETTNLGLKTKYLEIAGAFRRIFEREKPELRKVLGLDPMQLHDHPAYMMDLIRLDEFIVSLYNEHEVIPELREMRIFNVDIEVGKKIVTPLFTCQIVSYLDSRGHRRKLLIADVPYGETVSYLARYLADNGAKTILFSGIVGDVVGGEIGDVVAPREAFLADGTAVSQISNILAERDSHAIGVRKVKHIVVDSPYDETRAWIATQRARGIHTVDVELSYIPEALRDTDVHFGALNVVSDLVGVEGKTLAEQIAEEKRALIAGRLKIMDIFAELLGLARVSCQIHRLPHVILDVHNCAVVNSVGTFQVAFTHASKDRKRRLQAIAHRLDGVATYAELEERRKALERLLNCRILVEKITKNF